MKKISFILDGVTEWWFDNIIVELVRVVLKGGGSCFVVCPESCGYVGVGVGSVNVLSGLGVEVFHYSPLGSPQDYANNIDLVRSKNPDYVLCRSSFLGYQKFFDVPVKYLMEFGFPPVEPYPGLGVRFSDENIMSYGVYGQRLDERICNKMVAYLDGMRAGRSSEHCDVVNSIRSQVLSRGARKAVFWPAEYSHPEVKFSGFRYADGNYLNAVSILESLPKDYSLITTVHPLDRLYCDLSWVDKLKLENPDRFFEVVDSVGDQTASELACRASDGVVVDYSKAVSFASFYDKPFMRRVLFPVGEWAGGCFSYGKFCEKIEGFGRVVSSLDGLAKSYVFQSVYEYFSIEDPFFDFEVFIRKLDGTVDDRDFCHFEKWRFCD